MSNDNYLMLNGKRIVLTEEQIARLPKDITQYNPFERVAVDEEYYISNGFGEVST